MLSSDSGIWYPCQDMVPVCLVVNRGFGGPKSDPSGSGPLRSDPDPRPSDPIRTRSDPVPDLFRTPFGGVRDGFGRW